MLTVMGFICLYFVMPYSESVHYAAHHNPISRHTCYCVIYSAITSHTPGVSSPSFQLATPLIPWLCMT